MLLTINIRKYLVNQPRGKRARKAVSYVRDRVAHYTKTSIDNVKISQDLNSLIVKRVARKMTPVRLNVKIENGVASAEPFAAGKPEPQEAAGVKGGEKKAAAAKKQK
jgi:ribosomal protein L31E